MKYLFDGFTPAISELAHLSMYSGDNEFKVYAPEVFPVDNINISLLTYSVNTDLESDDNSKSIGTYIATPEGVNIINNVSTPNVFNSTTDFDAALDWCDIYVSDLKESPDKPTGGLKKAIKAEKEILFLHKTCKGALSESGVVTKSDIDKLETLYGDFTYINKPKITFVTSSFDADYNGRLEACIELARIRKDNGEKVAILSTENSAIPLQSNKFGIPIFTYNRDSSDLSVEDELKYLNLEIKCISKVTNCDIIFVVGQSSFGVPGALNDTVSSFKDTMLLHTLGADSVVILANPDSVLRTQRIINYLALTDIPVDCVYMYPVKGLKYLEVPGLDNKNVKLPCYDMYSGNRVFDAMAEIKGNAPYVFVYTTYMSIQCTFDMWCAEPMGLTDFASKKLVFNIIGALTSQKEVQSKSYVTGDLTRQITQVLKEESGKLKKLDKKLFKEISNRLGRAKL